MDNTLKTVLMILAMAGITLVIRMLPMTFIRSKIKSEFLNSFFFYVPYCVLAAMTFPHVFYISGSILSASIGTAVAIVAAVAKRSMIVVAALATLTVLVLNFIPMPF